jgi:hypothetical protein
MNGRIFQVTAAGEIVWEYVSPYSARPPASTRPSTDAPGARPAQPGTNTVYRAQLVPYDWVPAGIAHAEIPVVPPSLANFRVPPAPAGQNAAAPGADLVPVAAQGR